jgi:lysophospholipase L1-like esterase
MWKTANEAFPEKTIVNVGFGGSTLLDQIRYIDYVITPYKPRQIIIYCGENDIAYDSTVTGHEVLNRFIKLTELIRERFPDAHLSYVSMKPSPSREKLLPVYREGNELIKEYLKSIKRSSYINVFDAMLDSSGNPRRELFLGDMLHMNEGGYAIWRALIRPHLK